MNTPHRDDAALIARLNDLLQLDHDAVEAYTIAIDLVRTAEYRETLVRYRAEHKRHIEELASLIRARGGLPLELPHPTGPLKLLVQGIGAVAGDDELLLAFKAVEGQARGKYRAAARERFPLDVQLVIDTAAAEEEEHYDWVERTLTQRGIGPNTTARRVAGIVEGVHTAIANPIEAVERKVIEHVGRAVGTHPPARD